MEEFGASDREIIGAVSAVYHNVGHFTLRSRVSGTYNGERLSNSQVSLELLISKAKNEEIIAEARRLITLLGTIEPNTPIDESVLRQADESNNKIRLMKKF
ncbi:MAG: hypothetical protein UY63_C0004G0056 [Parcubacteria group bacterium GW2011_GWA2_51_10]|nr:MAG: hypothetical protein UY63_C0004G0056 [Parcubacteria group bacterium GW2011_GWA2_51_10]